MEHTLVEIQHTADGHRFICACATDHRSGIWWTEGIGMHRDTEEQAREDHGAHWRRFADDDDIAVEVDRRNEIVLIVDQMGGLPWLDKIVQQKIVGHTITPAPSVTVTYNHGCEQGYTCVWNAKTGLHSDGTPCAYAEAAAQKVARDLLFRQSPGNPGGISHTARTPDIGADALRAERLAGAWSTTPCTTCGHLPPCQCPGNPAGTS